MEQGGVGWDEASVRSRVGWDEASVWSKRAELPGANKITKPVEW